MWLPSAEMERSNFARKMIPLNIVESTHDARVFDIIKQRRSIGQFTQEQPTRAQIERLLEAATYAPNHYVAEPWHFFVLTGAAREKLGEVMAESLRTRMKEPGDDSEVVTMRLWKESRKPLRAPVIIAVATKGALRKNEPLIEDIEAASAGVQNMLLTVEELGLGAVWRTGDAAYDSLVKRWLGLTPEDHIVAFVYVGVPTGARQMRMPTHFSAKTTWLS
jgi:nitroreductase